MAELVDALDLGSSNLRCAGSSPVRRTAKYRMIARQSSGILLMVVWEAHNLLYIIDVVDPCGSRFTSRLFSWTWGGRTVMLPQLGRTVFSFYLVRLSRRLTPKSWVVVG